MSALFDHTDRPLQWTDQLTQTWIPFFFLASMWERKAGDSLVNIIEIDHTSEGGQQLPWLKQIPPWPWQRGSKTADLHRSLLPSVSLSEYICVFMVECCLDWRAQEVLQKQPGCTAQVFRAFCLCCVVWCHNKRVRVMVKGKKKLEC